MAIDLKAASIEHQQIQALASVFPIFVILQFHLELDYMKTFFLNNGFPIKFIDSCIQKFLSPKYSNSELVQLPNQQSLHFTLPFFRYQSEKLKARMTTFFNKYFQDIRFNIILVNNFRIGSFFHYKDKLPKSMQSSLIYKISCAQCASESWRYY